MSDSLLTSAVRQLSIFNLTGDIIRATCSAANAPSPGHMVQNAREAARWAGVYTEKYSKHFPNSD